jgi:hypothetical protein
VRLVRRHKLVEGQRDKDFPAASAAEEVNGVFDFDVGQRLMGVVAEDPVERPG